MSWFQEVKPYLLVARICGFAPYSYIDGSLSVSKTWKIYAYLLIILHLIFVFCNVYYISHKWNLIMRIGQLFLVVITTSALITEGFVCCRCFNELKTMIDIIENHDRSLRISFTRKYDQIRAWLIIGSFLVYRFHVMIFTANYTKTIWEILAPIFQMTMTGGRFFVVLIKFVAFVNSIERRFRHLSDMITADSRSMVYETNGFRRPIRLADIHRMHCNLMSAATILNELYNMVLLFLIGTFVYHSTANIYEALFIDTNTILFYKIGFAFGKSCQDFMGLAYLLSSCQRASETANKVGYTAFSPKSCVVRGRFPSERDEGFAIGQYFKLNSLQFTAAYGFMVVELPLLETLVAAITTMLVVFSKHNKTVVEIF